MGFTGGGMTKPLYSLLICNCAKFVGREGFLHFSTKEANVCAPHQNLRFKSTLGTLDLVCHKFESQRQHGCTAKN